MFESVQSALDPAGRGASRIGELACAVVLGGSLVAAIAVLLAICGVSIAFSHDAPHERLRVQLTSRQSWWEIHYEPRRDERVLVNELRVPLRRPVELIISAGNGSVSRFHVPALELEADAQPGQPARLLVIAMNRGVFPAEGGALAVIAEESADFDEWLARQAAPSVAPTDPALQDGRAAFFRASCNGCHAIRGTAAHGRAGPDLTHVGARRSLVADSLDEHLDTAMRRDKTRAGRAHQQLELRAIATYLASLK